MYSEHVKIERSFLLMFTRDHCCRDIKAENVLLTAEGQAKLADFGLGALTSAHQGGLIPTFAGTANCAAPEVLARRGGYAGGPADIWSLGTSLRRTESKGTLFGMPPAFLKVCGADIVMRKGYCSICAQLQHH